MQISEAICRSIFQPIPSRAVFGGSKMNDTSNPKDLKFPVKNRDVLYQVSLLQSLANGDYTGSVTVGELKQHGDIGIGTFDRLNGEMIMLDGEAHRLIQPLFWLIQTQSLKLLFHFQLILLTYPTLTTVHSMHSHRAYDRNAYSLLNPVPAPHLC